MTEKQQPVVEKPAQRVSHRQHWPLEIPTEELNERFFGWVENEKDVSPRIRISIEVTLWLMQVDAFRQKEEELLIADKYEGALLSHRPAILNLISKGEKLILLARE